MLIFENSNLKWNERLNVESSLTRIANVINKNCEHKVVEINVCWRTNIRMGKIANRAKLYSRIANIKKIHKRLKS